MKPQIGDAALLAFYDALFAGPEVQLLDGTETVRG
jgi:hypothetical protein